MRRCGARANEDICRGAWVPDDRLDVDITETWGFASDGEDLGIEEVVGASSCTGSDLETFSEFDEYVLELRRLTRAFSPALCNG
jgi:hypothetical protein